MTVDSNVPVWLQSLHSFIAGPSSNFKKINSDMTGWRDLSPLVIREMFQGVPPFYLLPVPTQNHLFGSYSKYCMLEFHKDLIWRSLNLHVLEVHNDLISRSLKSSKCSFLPCSELQCVEGNTNCVQGEMPKKMYPKAKTNAIVSSQKLQLPLKKFHLEFNANVSCAGTFCFVLIACVIWEHAFSLLGVGLCLCFKLKRLKTELWTSSWPTESRWAHW